MGLFSEIGNIVGDVLGGITGAKQAGEAAQTAAGLQSQFAQQGIDEQRKQFAEYMRLMAPYLQAGSGAIGEMQNISGAAGQAAQENAIRSIESSPMLQAQIRQGEQALLQRASATGGLRGGNLQGALAQYRPQMLQQEINNRFARLGGLAQAGLGSAQGLGGAGQSMAGNVGNLLGQMGSAQAGGIMAKGLVPRQTFGDLAQIASLVAAMSGFGGSSGGGMSGGGMSGGGLAAPKTGYFGGA